MRPKHAILPFYIACCAAFTTALALCAVTHPKAPKGHNALKHTAKRMHNSVDISLVRK